MTVVKDIATKTITVEKYLEELFKEAKASKPIMMSFVNGLRKKLPAKIREAPCERNLKTAIRTGWAEVGLMNPLRTEAAKKKKVDDTVAKVISVLKNRCD